MMTFEEKWEIPEYTTVTECGDCEQRVLVEPRENLTEYIKSLPGVWAPEYDPGHRFIMSAHTGMRDAIVYGLGLPGNEWIGVYSHETPSTDEFVRFEVTVSTRSYFEKRKEVFPPDEVIYHNEEW